MKALGTPASVVIAATDPQAIAPVAEAVRTAWPLATVQIATEARQVPSLLATYMPDWLLLDLNLFDELRSELARMLEGQLRLTLVAIAGHNQDDRILPALRFGASGYVTRREKAEDIARQLAWIRQGYRPMTPALAGQILRELDWRGQGGTLEENERELLTWVSSGDSPVEAAARMRLGPGLVDRTIAAIWNKTISTQSPVAGPVFA